MGPIELHYTFTWLIREYFTFDDLFDSNSIQITEYGWLVG